MSQSVHLKIRVKCSLCGKKANVKFNLESGDHKKRQHFFIFRTCEDVYLKNLNKNKTKNNMSTYVNATLHMERMVSQLEITHIASIHMLKKSV